MIALITLIALIKYDYNCVFNNIRVKPFLCYTFIYILCQYKILDDTVKYIERIHHRNVLFSTIRICGSDLSSHLQTLNKQIHQLLKLTNDKIN